MLMYVCIFLRFVLLQILQTSIWRASGGSLVETERCSRHGEWVRACECVQFAWPEGKGEDGAGWTV